MRRKNSRLRLPDRRRSHEQEPNPRRALETKREVRMGRFSRLLLLAVACLVIVSAVARAQGGCWIAGVVKDPSGAVLPGVTVEAASPALLEKTRTAVTDGAGQYKVINLLPGVYTVTFTLSGFAPLKREGIELTGSFVATVNADMKV